MSKRFGVFSNIFESGFMRSVFSRVLAIFLVFSIIITVVAFVSFTVEIRKSILLDRQQRLATVEKAISDRMDELTSIAYNVGSDPVFYLDSVEGNKENAREMSDTLKRYLVGNGFIEHLAFCRTSEPDKIYVSTGERSLSEFLVSSFGLDADKANSFISYINSLTKTKTAMYGSGKNAYFAFVYPLPQLSAKPQAHVLMLIPVSEVQPLLESLLVNYHGEAIVFDADNNEVYHAGDLQDELDLTAFLNSDNAEEDYTSPAGEKYVLQKIVSDSNSWTYVSVMHHSDTLSGLANKQFVFIAVILLLLVIAVVLMLVSVFSQYKPIRNLAKQVADNHSDEDSGEFVDERAFLSDKIATLKDNSEQKQKYETAFYEAEAANKAKSAFLSSMSHDIRTPMNAIIGMTAIARKHIDDSEYVDDCLKKVQASSNYLLDIINNVLDMSRIESGKIPIAKEPLLIPVVIDNVVSLMTSSIEAKSQQLNVDVDGLEHTAVLGDNIHIVQIFVNILSNAVKFTPDGGKLGIKVTEKPSDNPGTGIFEFAFSDTGIGIPPEFIGKVFDTFTRASDSTVSKSEGTGLGMAIAKKLVELMNGTISCESSVGNGTTFFINIPMQLMDEGDAVALTAASGEDRHLHSDSSEISVDLTGKRILLVEDNAVNREIASLIISETNAEIVEAYDGSEAVKAFSEHEPGYFDFIFMDIQMPVMNGYDAAAAIRAMERTDASMIPIYAMTANTFDEDIRHVKESGMNGHIGKPYNPQRLFEVLSDELCRK